MAAAPSESCPVQATAASRKVLITGVSKGLGRALALEMASRGHTIFGCSRDQNKLHSLQAQLSKLSPNHHFIFKLDVRSDKNVEELAQKVVEKKVVPNIIVNNAGVAHRNAKIWELNVEGFNNAIDTNVKGISNILRHFIPLMIPNKQGIIVNISSRAGRDACDDLAAYCASKWAIEGLSKCIAKGLPKEMTTVALDPGTIHTDMLILCLLHLGTTPFHFQSPQKWATKAATMILDLSLKDNGASLTIENPDELSSE